MAAKIVFKSACALMAMVAFAACSVDSVEGKWAEPVPGMENQAQGVNLERGGKASSINMATLQYEKWERKGNTLFLSGKSIGNHTTISFIDAFAIEKLTENELVLKKGSLIINYRKQ